MGIVPEIESNVEVTKPGRILERERGMCYARGSWQSVLLRLRKQSMLVNACNVSGPRLTGQETTSQVLRACTGAEGQMELGELKGFR